MERCRAWREPANPQIAADNTNTSSLVRATSNPQAAARFSFSRITSITAPKGELKIREIRQIAMTTKKRITYYLTSGFKKSTGMPRILNSSTLTPRQAILATSKTLCFIKNVIHNLIKRQSHHREVDASSTNS